MLAICGQIVFLILLMIWTRGRRFARPLPLVQADRRSSLEFVASMAELQQRAARLRFSDREYLFADQKSAGALRRG